MLQIITRSSIQGEFLTDRVDLDAEPLRVAAPALHRQPLLLCHDPSPEARRCLYIAETNLILLPFEDAFDEDCHKLNVAVPFPSAKNS